MSIGPLVHVLLHFFVPLIVARQFFRARWRRALILMLCGWMIDVDHLVAEPVYAPNRCSIGFHPLHRAPAIALYGTMLVLPQTRVLGLGLVIHIALDAADCVRSERP